MSDGNGGDGKSADGLGKTDGAGKAAGPVSIFDLTLYQAGFGRFGTIEPQLVMAIDDLLDAKVKSPPESTEIDLWLESPGGDADAAYKVVLALRQRCRHLRVVVPDYAKSAATLMTLGADKIMMASTAELGPLDAQITHPNRENIVVSALDISDSIAFLGQVGVELAISGGGAILEYSGLALELMRGIVRVPLGEDPERDERIRRAWKTSR